MPNPYTVNVSVDAGGNVGCSPDPVRVSNGAATLHFVMQTPGYTFTQTDAVVVADPGDQFPNPSQSVPPSYTTATLHDANSRRGDFKYTVYVQRTSDGRRFELDPIIQNDT